jgi:large subunit ribosomal protein L32
MANPKKRTSQRKRDTRRAHDALTAANLRVCSNCQSPKLPHHVCPKCGFYRRRSVIQTEW